VRDGWAPYRQFELAGHQNVSGACNSLREIVEAHPRASRPQQVKAVLREALDLRDRVTAGDISRMAPPSRAPSDYTTPRLASNSCERTNRSFHPRSSASINLGSTR
jgi:hypothetical protein